jgi:hypothetical protein
MAQVFKKFALILCASTVVYVGIRYLPTYVLHTQKQQDPVYTSRILESSSIRDILWYAQNQKTLVVFDLDNTLVYANQDLGSDAWFFDVLNEKIASGLSREEALAIVLPMYYEVSNHITLSSVEPDSPAVLSTLQNNGIPTVALTTRSLPLVERTKIQVQDAGFNFAACKLFAKDLTLELVKPALLTHGIIFCNDNNKGQTLLKMLEACNFKPETIVFIDDKLSHLVDVEKECLLNKIQFIGIRYGKLDSIATQFDAKRAEQQYIALLGKDYAGQTVAAA